MVPTLQRGRCWDTGQWLSKRVTLEHVLKPLRASDSAFELRKLTRIEKNSRKCTPRINADNLYADCEALLIELEEGLAERDASLRPPKTHSL